MEAQSLPEAVRWFVIARGGDLILRVSADMRLGENPAGDLSILESDGLIVFETEDEGDLILRIGSDQHRFELPDGSDSEVFRLQPGTRATIEFGGNRVRIDTDFGGGTPSNHQVRLTVAPVPEVGPPAAVPEAEPSASVDAPSGNEKLDGLDAGDPGDSGDSGYSDDLDGWDQAEADFPQADEDAPGAATRVPVTESDEEGAPSSREPSRQRRRHPAAIIAGAALTLLAIGGIYIMFGSERPPASSPLGAAENLGGKRNAGNELRTENAGNELVDRPGPNPAGGEDAAVYEPVLEQPPPLEVAVSVLPPSDASSLAETPVPDSAEEPAETPVPDSAEEPAEAPASDNGEDPGESWSASSVEDSGVTPPTTPPATSVVPAQRVLPRDSSAQTTAARAEPQGQTAAPPPPAPEPAPVERAQPQAEASAAALANLERQRTLARDLQAAAQALESGRLVPPSQPNALALYQDILDYAPRSEAAVQGLLELRSATLDRVKAFLEVDDLEAAVAALGDAEKAGADPQTVEQLRAELADRQRQSEGVADLYPISELRVIRMDPPRYPRRAPPGGEASIRVTFTVSEEGRVRDVELEGDASGAFERAATRAVSRWRFEPVREGGRAIPVRTAVTVEFLSD